MARFTDKQIMQALIEHGSGRGAARALGCSRETIHRRLADSAFASALYDARQAAIHETAGELTAAASKALSALMSVMENSEDERLRISAADKVLTHAVSFGKLSKAIHDNW